MGGKGLPVRNDHTDGEESQLHLAQPRQCAISLFGNADTSLLAASHSAKHAL